MKKIITSFLVTSMLFCVAPINIFAEETTKQPNNTGCSFDFKNNDEKYPVVNKKYDRRGNVVEFSIMLGEENHAFFENSITDRAVPLSTIIEFVSGACFIGEVIFDISCAKIAREIGIQFINGYYMMGKRKYSGKWKVTYGYIPGCEPRHSGSCFAATYKKI